MKYFVAMLILITISGCFGTEPEKTGKEGKLMPEFSLILTDSITKIHTREIPFGKSIVFFYFSPHCPYCKTQAKKIIEDIEMFKDIQFYFVSSFPLADVKEFCNEYQLARYPNITTGLDSAFLIGEYFEIPGIPYLAIYGKDKRLNKTFLGKIYNSQLKKVAEE